MPRAEFPEERDVAEGTLNTAVTVLSRLPDGRVMILINTADGWHPLLAPPERWERIMVAIRASLGEPAQVIPDELDDDE